MRHPSRLSIGHQQGAQRAARELAPLNARGDRAAMGGNVEAAGIVPFRRLPPHPCGALQPAGGASIIGHRSTSSEGFAHGPDQPLGLRLPAGHLAQRFQAGGDVGDQHVDDGQRMVWLAPLLGWARRGDRRHAWVCVAGAAVLFGIVMGA